MALAAVLVLTACGAESSEQGREQLLLEPGAPTAPTGSAGRAPTLIRPDLPAEREQLQPPKSAPAGCDPSQPPRAALFTSTKPGSGGVSSSPARYSIYSTTAVFVVAFLENVCGEHLARFEVFAPDGSPYMERRISFSTDTEQPGVLQVPGGYLVGIPFRITGTEVGTRPILGVWSVNFLLETAETARAVGLFETAS